MPLPGLPKETSLYFYNGFKAFRKKKVYVILPFNNYVANIDTAMTDMYAVGKILHPERFSGIEVRKRAMRCTPFCWRSRSMKKWRKFSDHWGQSCPVEPEGSCKTSSSGIVSE